MAGPYGFLVPQGWSTTPLTNAGGPASSAHFDDPASSAAIDYVLSGGEFPEIYNPDGTPNIHEALTLAGCQVKSPDFISSNKVSYACPATAAATEINGVIVVEPYPQGWKSLRTTLPRSQHEAAGKILNSLA